MECVAYQEHEMASAPLGTSWIAQAIAGTRRLLRIVRDAAFDEWQSESMGIPIRGPNGPIRAHTGFAWAECCAQIGLGDRIC